MPTNKNNEGFKFEFEQVTFEQIKSGAMDFQIIDDEFLLNGDFPKAVLRKPHQLDFNIIIIVYAGSGRHYVDFEPLHCKAGSVLFIAKNQVTAFDLDAEMKYYVLEFSDAFFSQIPEPHLLDMFDYMRYSPLVELDEKALTSLLKNIELLRLQLGVSTDDLSEPLIQSLFNALLLQLKRQRIKNTVPITAKDAQIYNNFIHCLRNTHDYTRKVEDYANHLNITAKTLTRIVKKYTGKTAKVCLNDYLILQIKRHLQREAMTLQAISDALNFDEVTNLVKFFKKSERISPSDFRKGLK